MGNCDRQPTLSCAPQELCETARSAVTSQRILALETLAAILHTAAEGGYDANGACDSAVIWDALMGMGISLFLRKAMDDPAHSVCVAGTKVSGHRHALCRLEHAKRSSCVLSFRPLLLFLLSMPFISLLV